MPPLIPYLQNKIWTLPQALLERQKLQSQGLTLVWTNGCFDLIHLGHLTYLHEARGLGDRLIVGLNSDASVRILKGANRPIFEEKTRALKLASMECIYGVIVFDEETPLRVIAQLKPDILVKGGDYRPQEIVGHDIVTAYGGRVLTLPFLKGHSSSYYIEKIKKHEG